jgi:hypothetical protein
MAIRFNWTRFWCPRGETIHLGDGGYLSDPESEWARHFNPRLVPLSAMNDFPCVALLGEPGKSWDLACQYEELQPQVTESGGKIRKVDLRSYADESRLMRDLFESEGFKLSLAIHQGSESYERK